MLPLGNHGPHNLNVEIINNIAYADEMSLLSPSPKGLQKLIDICKEYGKTYIKFNHKESMCMCFTGKTLKIDLTLSLTINVQFVHKAKYLGYSN